MSGSMLFNNPETTLLRRLTWLAVGACLSLSAYLLTSVITYRIGFPLDDAWIHQTYARNLAARGEWAFIPGQPSAGSTAPAWSALLAVGHWLGLGPYLWTYFLGWILLGATGWAGMRCFQRLLPQRERFGLCVGVFLIFEWHLVWAAGSGMETLLLGALILVVAGNLASEQKQNWFALGVLIGAGVWVRPDSITLAGPALWVLMFREKTWKSRARAAMNWMTGWLLLFAPYLMFNKLLAGNWWPNTFFAKQAEYAILRDLPLWRRYFAELSLPMIGAGAVLLPGFLLRVVHSLQRKAWHDLALPLWFAGYLFIYALRLPVVYQHGRYIIPAMPVFFVWGLAGLVEWIQPQSAAPLPRVVSRVWLLSLGLVGAVFWVAGARAYGRDVAVIESEMVATARWTAENTDPDALIAAHDIGALGYFGDRQLLDLAGLVSPEVIPFIRDEERLAAYLDAQQADYLITFPDWYPRLIQGGRLIYTTGAPFSPALGGTNMAVYAWEGLSSSSPLLSITSSCAILYDER